MYDRILVPTDGSDGARAALTEAIGLADASDATVHVLYVIDRDVAGTDANAPEVLASLEEVGEDIVTDALERAESAGVDAVSEILTGTPATTIVDYAADEDVDLIVMGTKGRTGLERYLLGSVTERVVRTAEVPVLTTRAAE